MVPYLISLPVWNFVLPVYAFWHFDDFSWGQTRQLEGVEDKDDHAKKTGEFDPSKVTMKRWHEYRRQLKE
jgi:chitin synthase